MSSFADNTQTIHNITTITSGNLKRQNCIENVLMRINIAPYKNMLCTPRNVHKCATNNTIWKLNEHFRYRELILVMMMVVSVNIHQFMKNTTFRKRRCKLEHEAIYFKWWFLFSSGSIRCNGPKLLFTCGMI